MAHPRKLLRQALAAQLVAAGTAADDRVHSDRVDPYKRGALPAISVYVLREEIDRDASENTAPRELVRDAKIEIAGFVSGSDEGDVADAMDDIAEEIENAVDEDRYIDGKANDSILESTVMEIKEGGTSDPLIGIVALTYSVTYRTSPADPADLQDFERVRADHRIVEAVEANQASDEFVVEETP